MAWVVFNTWSRGLGLGMLVWQREEEKAAAQMGWASWIAKEVGSAGAPLIVAVWMLAGGTGGLAGSHRSEPPLAQHS